MKPPTFTIMLKKCEKNAFESNCSVSKSNFVLYFCFVFHVVEPYLGHSDENEQHWDKAEILSFLAMCNTLWFMATV